MAAEGLELTHARPSAYGLVPTTIGCADEAPMHEGDPVDLAARAAELPEMAGSSWLPRECS